MEDLEVVYCSVLDDYPQVTVQMESAVPKPQQPQPPPAPLPLSHPLLPRPPPLPAPRLVSPSPVQPQGEEHTRKKRLTTREIVLITAVVVFAILSLIFCVLFFTTERCTTRKSNETATFTHPQHLPNRTNNTSPKASSKTEANQKWPWKRIQGNLKQIDIGINGSTWGVNRCGEIFVQIASTWKQIVGCLEHVTTGASGVWGVSCHDEIFFRRGVTSGNVEGSSWTQIPKNNAGFRLKQIDSGPFGIVYGVTTNDQIYCRSGITHRSPEGTGWVHVPRALKYVSCGKFGCWGVSRDDQIWFRNGITPHRCAGKSWTKIPGSVEQLEVNSLGHTTGVYIGGTLWTRLGITACTPTGTGWRQVTDERFTFVATGKSKLMALKADGSIFQYSHWKETGNEKQE